LIWARPSHSTGVNTVLEIGTNQAETQPKQLRQIDLQGLRIATNDKGIAKAVYDLSNPLEHAYKADALFN
jgi:hypothetical protein